MRPSKQYRRSFFACACAETWLTGYDIGNEDALVCREPKGQCSRPIIVCMSGLTRSGTGNKNKCVSAMKLPTWGEGMLKSCNAFRERIKTNLSLFCDDGANSRSKELGIEAI